MKGPIIKIKSADCLRKLDSAGFFGFVEAFETLCRECGLRAEADRVAAIWSDAKAAYATPRSNAFVPQQRRVHTALRHEVAIVCSVLHNSDDDLSHRAYEAYCRLVKGRFHSGMYVFVGAVSYFVSSSEAAALTGYGREKVERLKELLEEFYALDNDKIKLKMTKKLAKKGGDFRRDMLQYVELVRAKLMMMALESGDVRGVEEFNELMCQCRRYRMPKKRLQPSENEPLTAETEVAASPSYPTAKADSNASTDDDVPLVGGGASDPTGVG